MSSVWVIHKHFYTFLHTADDTYEKILTKEPFYPARDEKGAQGRAPVCPLCAWNLAGCSLRRLMGLPFCNSTTSRRHHRQQSRVVQSTLNRLLGHLLNGFNGISYHCYADNTELHFSVKPNNLNSLWYHCLCKYRCCSMDNPTLRNPAHVGHFKSLILVTVKPLRWSL